MKVVDIDKLFRNFVADYLKNKKDAIKDADIEENMEFLYQSFQNTSFDELDKKTPADYYSKETYKLKDVLIEHFKTGVPVSDYLIEAIKHSDNLSLLEPLIDEETLDDLNLILLEVFDHSDIKIDDNRLIALLFSDKTSEEVKNCCQEYLLNHSDKSTINKIVDRCFKEDVISGAIMYLLSRQPKSPKIFQILSKEFVSHYQLAYEYAGYLSHYGDEGFLPYLYEAADRATDYVNYKEILLAIEALGGTYDKKRDFSGDKNYKKIKEAILNEHKDKN